MLRTILLVLAVGGCAHANEVPPNESSGPAMAAKSFFCSSSAESNVAGFCATDLETCTRIGSKLPDEGSASACVATTVAVCYVTTTDHKDRFVCGPNRPSCMYQRDKERRRNDFDQIGECVEQHAGA